MSGLTKEKIKISEKMGWVSSEKLEKIQNPEGVSRSVYQRDVGKNHHRVCDFFPDPYGELDFFGRN